MDTGEKILWGLMGIILLLVTVGFYTGHKKVLACHAKDGVMIGEECIKMERIPL